MPTHRNLWIQVDHPCLLPRTLFTLRPSNIQRLIGNFLLFLRCFLSPFFISYTPSDTFLERCDFF